MVRDTLMVGSEAEENCIALREVFEDGYRILSVSSSKQAMECLLQERDRIAVVILDIVGEGREFQSLMPELRGKGLLPRFPVVVLLAPSCELTEEEVMDAGAMEVMRRPFTTRLLQRRVQMLANVYNQRWNLEDLVTEQARVLDHSNEMMVGALSNIIEHRSLESGQHVSRIRGFTKLLLQDMAKHYPEYELTDNMVDMISSAAALHDIGKISVPDAVLNKPGRLTPEEFEIMKAHTTSGSHMLKGLNGIADETYLYYAYNICRHHHERWDGRGYPDGLDGDNIPIAAQAVGLADVYDALTTPRVYKEAYSTDRAVTMILNGECGVFSPKILDSFLRVKDQFAELARLYADQIGEA